MRHERARRARPEVISPTRRLTRHRRATMNGMTGTASESIENQAAFVRSVADLPWGDDKPSEWGKLGALDALPWHTVDDIIELVRRFHGGVVG